MAIEHIDLTDEIRDWEKAIYGREVRSANVKAFEKIQTSVNGAIDTVEDAANQSNNAVKESTLAVSNANAALKGANEALTQSEEIRQDIVNRVVSGEFKGDKGDKGDKGAQGESGVMVPTDGMFSLYLDPETGNLYAEYPEGGKTPAFEYDSKTGNLYYITDGGGTV